jgi:F-type H+-transporting ATPase subunit c
MEDYVYFAKAASYIAAALAVSWGTVGPALSQGMVASRACEAIGKYPENTANVRGILIIALGMIETASIFALVIAVLLVFRL